MSKPTVSVILPTFNRALMLEEGLESLRKQEWTDWELIVVDDGSTESNAEVCKRFCESVNQTIHYIYQENKGPGVARQKGLETCSGEYIAFMDSDDPWFPHHLLQCVKFLQENHDVDWIIAPSRIVDSNTGARSSNNSLFPADRTHWIQSLNHQNRGDAKVILDKMFIRRLIENDFLGGLQFSMVRRQICEDIKFLPLRHYEDNAFILECCVKASHCAYFTVPHGLYRIHGENTSLVAGDKTNITRRIEAYRCSEKFCRYLLGKNKFSKSERWALRKRIAKDKFWNLGYSTLQKNGLYSDARREFIAAMKEIYWLDIKMAKTLITHIFRYSL